MQVGFGFYKISQFIKYLPSYAMVSTKAQTYKMRQCSQEMELNAKNTMTF